jgi:hypothetical protein
MKGIEADRALAQLLALLPEGATPTIYYEPSEPELRPEYGQKTTERSIAWHSTREVLTVLDLIADSRLRWHRKLFLARLNLSCYAWNRSNYAQGPRLLKGLLGDAYRRPSDGRDRTYISAGAGYQALEESRVPSVLERHAELVNGGIRGGPESLRQKTRELESLLTGTPPPIGADSAMGRFVQRQRARAEGRGAEFAWLVPPNLRPYAFAHATAALAPETFFYNDPTRFPNYFLPAHHFDKNHLDRKTAEAFTRRFARDSVVGSSQTPR